MVPFRLSHSIQCTIIAMPFRMSVHEARFRNWCIIVTKNYINKENSIASSYSVWKITLKQSITDDEFKWEWKSWWNFRRKKNRNAGQVIALTYFALNSWVGIQFVCVFFLRLSRSLVRSYFHYFTLHFFIQIHWNPVCTLLFRLMLFTFMCTYLQKCLSLFIVGDILVVVSFWLFFAFFSPLSCPRHTLSFQYVDYSLSCVFFLLYFQINNILSGICYCCWLIHLPLLFWLLFSDRLCTYIDQVVTIS